MDCCCFFFSSRRRHTICSRDWSSDVCSSDLPLVLETRFLGVLDDVLRDPLDERVHEPLLRRSEERRVGKGSRARLLRSHHLNNYIDVFFRLLAASARVHATSASLSRRSHLGN